MINIYNEECIQGSTRIKDESVDLIICDPPFGIDESSFQKYYKRKQENIIQGYTEAPENYAEWTLEWITQAKRILKSNGSLYIVSGWTNLIHVLNACQKLDLKVINHITWKYNFGVNTTKKFVSSHYVIVYATKQKAKPTFNTFCRFGPQEKNNSGGSMLYQDLEDVFVINKEYLPNQKKNINKLPDELLRKLILYSSNKDDLVCDFFMGNFTTAYVAHKLGRNVTGFEINPEAYNMHINELKNTEKGCDLKILKTVEIQQPKNQGKPITIEERTAIMDRHQELKINMTKKAIIELLCEEFERGKFGILNIIDS